MEMKHLFWLQVLKGIKKKPGLFKRLKILAIIGGIGFVVLSSLLIWAGVASFQYVAGLAQGTHLQAQVAQVQTEIQKLPGIATVGCWEKAQSLLNVQSWVERPAMENFKNLKDACFEANVNTEY